MKITSIVRFFTEVQSIFISQGCPSEGTWRPKSPVDSYRAEILSSYEVRLISYILSQNIPYPFVGSFTNT